MIKFGLRCAADHGFEGWFASSDEYEQQRRRGFVQCPACGTTDVRKALMAPSVSTSRDRAAVRSEMRAKANAVMGELRRMREQVTANAEDVGPRFAEEARRIHYGEVKPKAVYGQASEEEVGALLEEGVAVAPLPVLPEDRN